MAYEEAMSVINALQHQLSGMVRGVVDALKDGKISTWEIMALGIKGMGLANAIMSMMQDLTPELRAAMLDVLEHGEWSMPEV